MGYIIVLSILVFVFIFVFILPLYRYHYCRDSVLKKYNSKSEKYGYDITRLGLWFFSVEGLLFVLVGAIVAFMVVFMCNFCNIGEGRLQLTAFTLNLAICTLIPTLISRIVAKSHLDEIIEKKIETELNDFKTSLYSIRRDKGHSCRMSAVLLYQMASHQAEEALKDERNKEKHLTNAIKNAAWSIGWASDAIIQYLLIKDKYNNAIKRSEELITDYIIESYKCLKSCRDKLNHQELKIVRPRDLTTLFTMHALIKYYLVFKNDRYDNESLDTILKNIEVDFFKIIESNEEPVAHDCGITGMSPEFNNEIEFLAGSIIQEAKKKNKQEKKIRE